MGNKGGKAGGGPKPATIQRLVEVTNFTAAEVSSLWNTFVSIKEEMEAGAGGAASAAAAAAHGDLRISAAEFQAALGFRRGSESVFLGRIFGLFDENKDGYISFEEASAMRGNGTGGIPLAARDAGAGARCVMGALFVLLQHRRRARRLLVLILLLLLLPSLFFAVRRLHFYAHANCQARGARQACVSLLAP